MTDRELLEAAARAARLPEWGWMGPALMYVKDNTFTDWNPLTDDGDALRLAVKLDLLIDCSTYYYEPDQWRADPYEATRRAIVRAAAAFAGKTP